MKKIILHIVMMFIVFDVFFSGLPSQAQQPPPFHVEVVVKIARFPVALAFAPDGPLFYTEKETGGVRVVNPDGLLQSEPVIELPTDNFVERGMLGIAIDPNFTENHYIWVYHTQPNTIEPPFPINKVVRFREEEGIGYDPIDMFEVPIFTREGYHNGGNIHFGYDGMLFISVGDIGNPALAQDPNEQAGRIHRFMVDGDTLVPAPDNPIPGNSTWALGLRNPFDFDFDPYNGNIIAGENGTHCDDEINVIFPGGNYGWYPGYDCDDQRRDNPGVVYPMVYFSPVEAITGVMVYDGIMFPEWLGDVFFCSWNTGLIRRLILTEGRTLAVAVEILRLPNYSCATDLEVAPDGSIYFTGFESIYRLVRD